jgi:type II secretory pathway component PulK
MRRGRDVRTHRGRRQRGVALILTLLVLSILVVVVVQFSYAVKVESRIVQNGLQDQQLTVLARGTIPVIAALFRDDRKNGKTPATSDTLADCYNDPKLDDTLHTLTLGDAQVVFRVEDLDRRLSLEWLTNDKRHAFMLRALTRLLGHPNLAVPKPDDVAKKIDDKVHEIAGLPPAAETPAATPGQPPPPPPPPAAPATPANPDAPAKRAILNIEQLLDIQGIEDFAKVLYGDPTAKPNPTKGLAQFVTCWPTDTLNLNTMPAEVLWAVLPDTDLAAPTAAKLDPSVVVPKIRAFRIDPDYENEQSQNQNAPAKPGQPPPPPPPPPPAAGGTGSGSSSTGSGASKGWNPASKAFEKVDDLTQVEGLKKIFKSDGTVPQLAAGAAFSFQTALATESRLYGVLVTITPGGGSSTSSLPPPTGVAADASGASKTVRMVLARNKQDEVAPLLVREEPR